MRIIQINMFTINVVLGIFQWSSNNELIEGEGCTENSQTKSQTNYCSSSEEKGCEQDSHNDLID